ncbi:MAG: hypothetical protein LLG04_02035 [Parachlamydia sp.]|nr:hypothetical protein [Parachlamydia sp.]
MTEYLIKALQHHPLLIKCWLTDHLVLRTPVPVAFFYREPIPVEKIIDSLGHVLSDFPLFAGRIVKRQDQICIDCGNQGVQLRTLHVEGSLFQQLAQFEKLEDFVDLVDPWQGPVLTMKLSYFSDGMALGCCWHHSVGDMSSFMEFLKALSAFATGKSYQTPCLVKDRESYLEPWLQPWLSQEAAEKHCRLKRLSPLDILRFLKQIYSPKKSVYLYFTQQELEALRQNLGSTLTRNDVLSAHLLNLLACCRTDQKPIHNASIVLNFRKRIGMPQNALGNYVDAVPLQIPQPQEVSVLAHAIHAAVHNYGPETVKRHPSLNLIEKFGGLWQIQRILPTDYLPHHRNLIITNWSNFDVYSIDFGLAKPHLFLPVGRALIPWVCCIAEGFDNQGLLAVLLLPSKVAKRLASPLMQEEVHKYRTCPLG